MLLQTLVCGGFVAGCPGAKKTEFLTSVLDALSTDMVHAVTDPASAGRYGSENVPLAITYHISSHSFSPPGMKAVYPFNRQKRSY